MSYLRTQAFQGRSQRIQADMEPVGGDLSLVRAERPAVGGTIQYIVRDGSGVGDLGKFKIKKVMKSVAKAVQKPVVKLATVAIAPVLAPAVLAKDALKVGEKVGSAVATIGKTVGAVTGLYKPKAPKLSGASYKGFTIQWASPAGPFYVTAAPDPAVTPMFADLNQPDSGYPTQDAARGDIDRVTLPPAGWLPPLSYQGFIVECDPVAINFIVTAAPPEFGVPAGSTFTGGPYPDQATAKAEIDKVLAALGSMAADQTGQTGASTTTTVATSDGTTATAAPTYKGFTLTSYPSGGAVAWYITANAGQVQLTGPLKNGPYTSQAEAQTAIDLASQPSSAAPAATGYGAPQAATSYPAFTPSMSAGGAYGGSSAADYSFESATDGGSYGEDAAASDYGDTGFGPAEDSGEMGPATSDEDATFTDEGDEGTNGLGDTSSGRTALTVALAVGLGIWLLTRKRGR